MRNLVLAPAGKQPVRIAAYMACGKKSDFNTSLSKSLFKFFSLDRVLAAVAVASSVTAFFAGVVLSETNSKDAWLTLAVSTVIALASLAPTIFKKGGAI